MIATIAREREVHTPVRTSRMTHQLPPELRGLGQLHPGSQGRYDDASPLATQFAELFDEALTGTPHTLTYKVAGQPVSYSFVVNGSDLDDAQRNVARVPSFKEWLNQQAVAVTFLAASSRPGIPNDDLHHDLRTEQVAASSPARPAHSRTNAGRAVPHCSRFSRATGRRPASPRCAPAAEVVRAAADPPRPLPPPRVTARPPPQQGRRLPHKLPHDLPHRLPHTALPQALTWDKEAIPP